jgi:hypothetical protein
MFRGTDGVERRTDRGETFTDAWQTRSDRGSTFGKAVEKTNEVASSPFASSARWRAAGLE